MTAPEVALSVAAVVLSYASGSIPFGLIVGRLVADVDIREHGSKNIGATNVSRVVGRPWGVLAFLLDVGKGLGPVLLLPWLVGRLVTPPALAPTHLALACAIAAILGHVFPFTLGFRGGKAVATSLGAMVGLSTVPSLAAFAIWVILTAVTRYVSVGSMVAAAAFPVLHVILTPDAWTSAGLPMSIFAIVLGLTIVIRHRANIRRLIAGAESKVGSRRARPVPPAE